MLARPNVVSFSGSPAQQPTYGPPVTQQDANMLLAKLLMDRQSQQQQPQQSFSPNPSMANQVMNMVQGSPAAAPSMAGPSGSGAAVSGGFPSSGATGVGSGLGGAPGGAAAAAPASSAAPGMSNLWGLGGSSGAGAFATPAAYAMLIGAGKMWENKLAQDNPNHPIAKAGMGLLGPSFNQYREDPKLLGLSLLGFPFLTPFFANEKAKKADPEFAGLWRGVGLPFS